jgi:hypothetical protein
LRPMLRARMMIEISIVIAIPASSASVVAAFLLLGFWNAGTPLEIASTPVNAAQPEENARASRKIIATCPMLPPYPGAVCRVRCALSTLGRLPWEPRYAA